MKKQILLTFLIVLLATNLTAQQFDLSAELRPRYENKYGYQTLRSEGEDAGNFISQRTRLNFDFNQNKIKLKVSLQNVRVWGDVSTLSEDDNATALHEAWAEAVLSGKWALKLGRQEIVYDDHRIFGDVGWTQQARSHDAFLVKFNPNENHKIDFGLAYNADTQGRVDVLYSNVAGYKTFQYAWYHGKFNKFGVSALLLNTGVEYADDEESTRAGTENTKTDYMQTLGPRVTFKSGNWKADSALYYQMGESFNTDVSAFYFGGNLGYKITDEFFVGTGFEHLSGKDMDDTDAEINSFAPLFGTNHKFNGWMDYFYVGNHGGSVGLNDFNATIAYNKNKFSAKLIPHYFTAPAKVINSSGEKMDPELGTEIDFTAGYKISNSISLNVGYSLMYATDTMEVLKGGDKDIHNSWGWVMFSFKPKLFSYKPAED